MSRAGRACHRTIGEASTHKGSTRDQGLVEAMIPGDAGEGTPTIWLEDETIGPAPYGRPLGIGTLGPVETNEGVHAGPDYLSLACGAVAGVIGPKTQAALKAFQAAQGPDATARTDQGTRERLRQLHDLARGPTT